jgi:general stress protein YciG
MAGNKEGGRKTAETMIKRHGEDYYRRIGSKGGSVSHRETRYLYVNREFASQIGSLGGKKSKRGKAVIESEA